MSQLRARLGSSVMYANPVTGIMYPAVITAINVNAVPVSVSVTVFVPSLDGSIVKSNVPLADLILDGVGNTGGDQDTVQTLTFEGLTHLDQAFSIGGEDFVSTGDLTVQDGIALYGHPSAGGSETRKWFGTTYLVPAAGLIGTLTPASGVMSLRSMQAWTSHNGGDQFRIDDVTFTGVLPDNSTVVDVLTVTPTTQGGDGWDTIHFVNLLDVEIKELRVTLPGTLNYIGMDNIVGRFY